MSEKQISRKENFKECTSFEEQKGTRYIRRNVYFGIIIVFSCLSSTKPCLRFLLIYFAREMKGFYQSSLGNKVDLRDIMNVSRNILRALITATLMSSCHWKTLVSFCLRKKENLKAPCCSPPSGSMCNNHGPYILRIFDVLPNFSSPQVKRSLILSNKMVYTNCLTSCQMTGDFGS